MNIRTPGPHLDSIKDLLRKLDEACEAGAKLRARIVGQMRAARDSCQLADDDTEVVAARSNKPA
jgi:hypothetical protein